MLLVLVCSSFVVLEFLVVVLIVVVTCVVVVDVVFIPAFVCGGRGGCGVCFVVLVAAQGVVGC